MSLYATKAEAKRKIQALLDSNDVAVVRGILAIYAHQTASEQNCGGTIEDNGVGFSGVDAVILSSFATYYKRFGRLSEKQMAIARKKIKKYWNQLRVIAEEKYENDDRRWKQQAIDKARAAGLDP